MNKILKIGHRGTKGYVAENTLDSFQKAIDLGCDGIELDIHLSSDQKVVVIHDETIDRTTSGKGFVKDFTASELKKIGIPTLEEVFDLVNQNCFINVELKGELTAKFVVAIIEKYILEKKWSYHHFLVSSFDWNALHEVHNLHPEIPIGVLTQTDLDLAFAFAKFIKAKSIHPYFHLLTKEKVEILQEKGYFVFPWTVNEFEDIEKMKILKVNGIISDFPDRIN